MSGQPGQNSIFLTQLWCCSSSLTAEGGHRVTWETPALWRCHRSRPRRDRRVFKSKEANSEQSVTHRTDCPDSKCRGYPELQICGEGARCRNTSEPLWEPQTFLSEEDEKAPTAAWCSPRKRARWALASSAIPLLQQEWLPKTALQAEIHSPHTQGQWECRKTWGRKE